MAKRPPRNLDTQFHTRHKEVFSEIDCLDCANCCKTTSPVFRDRDVDRLARHLRLRPAAFTKQYLTLDEEQDYVLRSAPCPFLDLDDNTCRVYDFRPQACRGYPHTDRKNMEGILKLTERNTRVCPAVARIVVEWMKD
jgi:Fe-S-cluster containining protein